MQRDDQERVTSSRPLSRLRQLALFATAMAWAAVSYSLAGRAARGFTVRLDLGDLMPLLESAFLLFLIVVGFRVLDGIAASARYPEQVLSLPRRAGWPTEWGVGAALGWGLCLAAAVPVLLSGNLHARLHWFPGSAPAILLTGATLLTTCLAQELIFRGYAYRRLIAAFGPSWATVLLSLAFGVFLVQGNLPRHLFTAVLGGTLLGMLLATAWLRTHALWLGWGVHFSYRVVMVVVLGLPAAGAARFGAIADTYTSGPSWLSGGGYGLDAALLTAGVILVGIVVLYRVTREYAWRYTRVPIVAAGYEVVIAPPAAHVAMEQSAPPPPLVQILPATLGNSEPTG